VWTLQRHWNTLKKFRKATGEKLTITHVVGKAIGLAYRLAPDLNGRIVLGRFIPHKEISLCFLVVLEDGKNLSRVLIKNIDKKSLTEIIKELQAGSYSLREGKDVDFKKTMDSVKLLPTWVISPLCSLTGFFSGVLGINVPVFGITSFPFGSGVVTSIGMFGMEEAYAPFTAFFHVPFLMLIGSVSEKAVVREHQVVIRPLFKILTTADHRYLDGQQASKLSLKHKGSYSRSI